MNRSPTIGILLISLFLNCNSHKKEPLDKQGISEYVGRYLLKTDLVIEVLEQDSVFKILPSFWRSPRRIDSIGIDEFNFRGKVNITFERDSAKNIIALVCTGHNELEGRSVKLEENDVQPVELLISGNTNDAIRQLKQDPGILSEKRITRLAFNFLRNYPSRHDESVRFAKAFESFYPNSVDLQQTIGLGMLLSNNRTKAKQAFEKAYLLDKEDNLSINAIRLLGSEQASPAPSDGWKLSFSLDSLFMPPTNEEIEKVKTTWALRKLGISKPKIVKEDTATLWGTQYKLKIVQHYVHQEKHYGAVLIPEGATIQNSPVILEVRGVDPSYSPRDITKTEAYVILDKNEQKCIIAIPSLRGNTLSWNNEEFTSEGNPTDAWDGATDDAIAFLNVVLDIIPEADSTRIASFGQSRGGTVAILAAIRDPKIKSVVGWAGPSGWFSNMGTFGWRLQDQVQWGLWEKWTPDKGWGSSSQFIEWFLKSTIETGKPDLPSIRQKILASSPLYFLDQLPTAQMHYGKEDRSVPFANALAIKNRLNADEDEKYQIFIHENSGHDQPYPEAYLHTKAFFKKEFSKNTKD